ncbi:MAG: 2-oxoglutarate dehydrogenase E1 component, partial [Planctomycetaceae bacterium]|nr:2-oxoglutarate dehydrogenase E1 component [Planctomycetaceae bacterium]
MSGKQFCLPDSTRRAEPSVMEPATVDELTSQSVAWIEAMYEEFLRNPDGVPAGWRRYFDSLPPADRAPARVRFSPSAVRRSLFHPAGTNGSAGGGDAAGGAAALSARQERVDQLVRNFRVRGHNAANVDPLQRPRPWPAELDASFYGFTKEDLDRPFSTSALGGPSTLTLRQIQKRLKNTYCRSIGVQFMHIDDLSVRQWLQDRMETTENRIALTRQEQLRILTRLTDAAVFEEFLQKKFVGAKSFSLEGGETLIPLLEMAIERAGADGVTEVVFGMAHRGRLNVLANIMGKRPADVFREFEDKDPHLHRGRGDVKYHLGYSSDRKIATGDTVHLSLCFNPSHLEFVNPVALGRMRARQDRFQDSERKQGLVILIHGDAAFAGEGVVQETLNMSELPGYTVGGTVHVIVNNQVGFTTLPEEGRSSVYATDVAKLLQIPVFHVNGEDPEAVAQVVHLALDFRRTFQRDVVIDMYCYRRRGHNEGDEPSFTQPVLYRAIRDRESVRAGYLEHLLLMGGLTTDEADTIEAESRDYLERELEEARSDDYRSKYEAFAGIWQGYTYGAEKDTPDVETGVPLSQLSELLAKQTTTPESFHPYEKVVRILAARRKMAAGKRPLDWAAGEALAFGTLAAEGHRIRLTGQDAGRGTFSQRHAVLHDFVDGHTWVPLQHLSDDQGPVEIHNSPLSEAGVLGFDYGYSLDCPDGLVLWEAQFGDFVNAAQVIIDQFLSSAEDKWNRLSGLVLLLPHGFEGQGPEHSSARLERFLTLAAEDNMQIAQPTTPANYFHLLRRQVVR